MINDEALKSIENLHRLKTEGVITQEDFDKAKADLLSGAKQPLAPARVAPRSDPTALPAPDDHVGWMTLALRRYADFTGRSTRKEFWMFLLFTNLVAGGLAIFALADTNDYGGTGTIGSLMFGLIGIVILGAIVPFLAAQVRRFHDQDKSGWFALLNIIPYIGVVIVLILMLIDGTPGENRFGPDPKGRD